MSPRQILSLLGVASLTSTIFAADPRPATFCNPIDLPYRFQLKDASRREAADPTMVRYKDEWWLFASKSGGYWHTRDFQHWEFVEPTGLPIEDYAPTAEVIDGRLYFKVGAAGIYTTDDPAKGVWTKIDGMQGGASDADVFADTDGRVYLYYGCHDKKPTMGVEVDPKQNFKAIGSPVELIHGDRAHHGWEVKLEANQPGGTPAEDAANPKVAPWVEGSWMTKVGGKYYLQYAAPGTQLVSYADGVYVGDSPLGPFTYSPASPFSFKPTGFIGGAGHGSTFQDGRGNWWHIASMTIAVRHSFERRLGLFPCKFFPDGQLACNTYLGDYPQYLPGEAADPFARNSPGWMLLSLKKPVTVSSTLPGFDAALATDENIKTWWSAATGHDGEWLQVDLGQTATVQAVQINFADQGADAFGRLHDGYRYLLETSLDGKKWTAAIDRSEGRDSPHDYVQLPAPIQARYVRLTNRHMPGDAMFSISDLRVFGLGTGHPPATVSGIEARRDPADGRRATISWSPVPGADFYIVRYGIKPDRLYSNFQVYDATDLKIFSLNDGVPYYFTVDAVNSNGVTQGPAAVEAK